MGPYYSPDEFQEMEGFLDTSKGKSSDTRRATTKFKKQMWNEGMLPELIDLN